MHFPPDIVGDVRTALGPQSLLHRLHAETDDTPWSDLMVQWAFHELLLARMALLIHGQFVCQTLVRRTRGEDGALWVSDWGPITTNMKAVRTLWTSLRRVWTWMRGAYPDADVAAWPELSCSLWAHRPTAKSVFWQWDALRDAWDEECDDPFAVFMRHTTDRRAHAGRHALPPLPPGWDATSELHLAPTHDQDVSFVARASLQTGGRCTDGGADAAEEEESSLSSSSSTSLHAWCTSDAWWEACAAAQWHDVAHAQSAYTTELEALADVFCTDDAARLRP
jgi:hypothetical protein